jgi:hypothetical protein
MNNKNHETDESVQRQEGMSTEQAKEKLRYEFEAATGGHGVYTFELVEELMKVVSDYERVQK